MAGAVQSKWCMVLSASKRYRLQGKINKSKGSKPLNQSGSLLPNYTTNNTIMVAFVIAATIIMAVVTTGMAIENKKHKIQ